MPGALDGIRVVEFGRTVAAPYAARLLADLGADCVKVERPAGDPLRRRGPFPHGASDPERSALFHYVNWNKRGLVLNPRHPAGTQRLRTLLAAADVFVNDLQPIEAARLGLTPQALLALNPRLVAVSVTPYGMVGPLADCPAPELVQWAAGGYAHLTPAGGKRESGRPLKTAGFQAGFMAGASAAGAAAAALLWREQGGHGQHVDVSIQETLICANDSTFARYLTDGDNIPTRLVESSFEFLPCKDGAVSVLFVRDDQWGRMVELMGNPAWADTDLFATWSSRRANWDAVSAMLIEFFMQHGREELYRSAQAHRIPLAPVHSAADVVNSPHLHAREYFVDMRLANDMMVQAPGAPFKMAVTPWQMHMPAPSLSSSMPGPARESWPAAAGPASPVAIEGAAPHAAVQPAVAPSHQPPPHTAPPARPLAGVRVMDFTWVWAGPQSCRFLADLGAEVIKIESDRRIDNYRTAAAPDGTPFGLNRAPGFNTMNRNKLSVRIDLSTRAGHDLALRLAAVSDLVVENFAPRVMPGFGLAWADFAAVNPAIVMLSMSGFGGAGPDRDNVLYGNSQVALCGLGHATGFSGGPPENVGLAHGDPVAAYHASFAAMAGVFHARCSGQGQHIDMSQWEAMAATAPEGLLEYALNGREPERRGNADEVMAPHNYYRCRGDDAWIAIAVETDEQWQALCQAMNRPQWSAESCLASAAGRLARTADLDAHIEAWTAAQDPYALARRLQEAGVPAAAVASIADLARDEHLLARGFFEEIDHPEVGRKRYVGVPYRLSATPAGLYRHAPLFGGDAGYVLDDLLGLDQEERARLQEARALH